MLQASLSFIVSKMGQKGSINTVKLSSLITLLKREPDAGKREKGHRVTPFSQLNLGDNYAR